MKKWGERKGMTGNEIIKKIKKIWIDKRRKREIKGRE